MIYLKVRVAANSSQIALNVSEKVAVAGPVKSSSKVLCNSKTLRSKSCVLSFRATD